mgnify:FL=1
MHRLYRFVQIHYFHQGLLSGHKSKAEFLYRHTVGVLADGRLCFLKVLDSQLKVSRRKVSLRKLLAILEWIEQLVVVGFVDSLLVREEDNVL